MIRFICGALFRILAGTSAALAQEARQPVFRAETGLVQVYASIVDQSGKTINNVPADAIRVFEDGVPQQVRFVGQENVPVSASLAIDGDARPEPVHGAVTALLRSLESKEPVRVARFDSRADSSPAVFQQGRGDINVVPVRPRTPMRDVLLMLINSMESNSSEVKRTLVIVADAESYRSWQSWQSRQHVVDAAKEKDVSIYAIHLEAPRAENKPGAFNRTVNALRGALIWLIDLVDDDVPSPSELQPELARLTDATGGEICTAADQDAAIACAERFAGEIKSQYVIAYRPASLARRERKFEISIEGHPDATVRVRKASGGSGAANRIAPHR